MDHRALIISSERQEIYEQEMVIKKILNWCTGYISTI